MCISVQETTLLMISIDPATEADEYTRRAEDDSVTYSTSGDNFYVVSGYYNPEGNITIYYDRVDYDDVFRFEVNFQYPASRAEDGEEILLEFLKNYSIS